MAAAASAWALVWRISWGRRAGLEPFHYRLLGIQVRLGGRHGRPQLGGVQPCHYLPGLHPVAFFHKDFFHPLTGDKGQLHLPDVDVAVEGQLGPGS